MLLIDLHTATHMHVSINLLSVDIDCGIELSIHGIYVPLGYVLIEHQRSQLRLQRLIFVCYFFQ